MNSARVAALSVAAFALAAVACAPHHEPVDDRPVVDPKPFDAGMDAGAIVVTETDAGDGGCGETDIFEANPAANHVPVGTPLSYATTPPVGGDHFSLWADFQNYTAPIDAGYIVHSMEHGAVVLWYRCATRDACPGLATELENLAAATVPQDPMCAPYANVRRRIIVVPEPNLPTVVAASAWRYGLGLQCVDLPKIAAFIVAHYDRATESLCAPGITPPPR